MEKIGSRRYKTSVGAVFSQSKLSISVKASSLPCPILVIRPSFHLVQVMTFGRKKNAICVVTCNKGVGLLKINGMPLHLVQPHGLRLKAMVYSSHAKIATFTQI